MPAEELIWKFDSEHQELMQLVAIILTAEALQIQVERQESALSEATVSRQAGN